jgi:hypothetical protein
MERVNNYLLACRHRSEAKYETHVYEIPNASPPFNAAMPLGLKANSCSACNEYVLPWTTEFWQFFFKT